MTGFVHCCRGWRLPSSTIGEWKTVLPTPINLGNFKLVHSKICLRLNSSTRALLGTMVEHLMPTPYFAIAFAASINTWSSVSSRYVMLRSKYSTCMSRNGYMSVSLIICHTILAISSPSSSTIGVPTMIFSKGSSDFSRQMPGPSKTVARDAGGDCNTSRSSLTQSPALRAHATNWAIVTSGSGYTSSLPTCWWLGSPTLLCSFCVTRSRSSSLVSNTASTNASWPPFFAAKSSAPSATSVDSWVRSTLSSPPSTTASATVSAVRVSVLASPCTKHVSSEKRFVCTSTNSGFGNRSLCTRSKIRTRSEALIWLLLSMLHIGKINSSFSSPVPRPLFASTNAQNSLNLRLAASGGPLWKHVISWSTRLCGAPGQSSKSSFLDINRPGSLHITSHAGFKGAMSCDTLKRCSTAFACFDELLGVR
mmetsp:Transcript_36701/g.72640  ORF Transcript_36701/g.72640 Transcript_36701/m.72640 type:complete len:422 (-) Transcript_36701:217-1482(-)